MNSLRDRLLLLSQYKIIHAKAVLASANAFGCTCDDDAATYWQEASELAEMAAEILESLALVVDVQAGSAANKITEYPDTYVESALHVGQLCAECLLAVSKTTIINSNANQSENLRDIADRYRLLSGKARAVANMADNIG